jgi:hypothetical protein
VSLALLEVHIDRFAVANSLAGEWQRAVGRKLGDQDLTVDLGPRGISRWHDQPWPLSDRLQRHRS